MNQLNPSQTRSSVKNQEEEMIRVVKRKRICEQKDLKSTSKMKVLRSEKKRAVYLTSDCIRLELNGQ